MRADKYFTEKFGSRTKSAKAIENGEVLINGKTVSPSYEIKENDIITFVQPEIKYVSAGGFKLKKALNDFNLDVKGKIFADIGASTGGFTDCLLQSGAKKVYCVDVGESQLDKSLLDKNVVVIDNFNARNLTSDIFEDKLDAVVADVSFISQTYILEGISKILPNGGISVTLIKPQFELEKRDLGKNGIVKDVQARNRAVKRVCDCAESFNLIPTALTVAPVIKGKNIEYLLCCVKNGAKIDYNEIKKCVKI